MVDLATDAACGCTDSAALALLDEGTASLGKHCQPAHRRPVAHLKAYGNGSLLTVGDRCERLLGARPGQGRRGRTWLEPGGNGSQLADKWGSSWVSDCFLCGGTATKTLRLRRFRGCPHRPTLTALLQAVGVVSLSRKVAAQMKGRASSGPALLSSGSPAYGFRGR
jgi:hypothetical protein